MKKSKIPLFKLDNQILYREQNLIECQVPIFFVCIDDIGQRYLVINLDFEDDEYLIAKVTNTDIVDMLQGKIQMRVPFEKSKNIYSVYAGENFEKDKVIKKNFSDINEEDLPERNAYFTIGSDKELEDYILKINSNEWKLSVITNKYSFYSFAVVNRVMKLSDFFIIREEKPNMVFDLQKNKADFRFNLEERMVSV